MFKFLKKIMCKMSVCCNSKCSMNAVDTDNDGVPDTVEIKLN